jgi:hypothetical protein
MPGNIARAGGFCVSAFAFLSGILASQVSIHSAGTVWSAKVPNFVARFSASSLFLLLAISAHCVSAGAQQSTPQQSTPQQTTPQQSTPQQSTPQQSTPPESTPSITAPALDPTPQSVPVFITDFELSVSPAATAATQSASPSSTSARNRPATSRPLQTTPITPAQPAPRQPASVRNETDPPNIQARRMIDFFNLTLLQALQQNHFNANRVPTPTSTQNLGVLISGIFAEDDPQNRVRRGLLGSTAPGSKFLLYVGVFNLSRPKQPLYELAPVQNQDPRYGPVIALNNYIPLTKFEVDKNPTEEEVRKICAEIVANLVALLSANPAAFSN